MKNKLPTISFVAIALLGVLTGMRPGHADPADISMLHGAASIKLPHGWTANPKPTGRTLLVALAPQRDKDETGEFQSSLSITQDVGSKLDAAAQQKRLAADIKGYQAVEPPSPITINGLDGVTFGGTFPSGPLKLRSRQYMFTQNNQIFVITFTSLNSQWATYLPAVEASVATFTLKK